MKHGKGGRNAKPLIIMVISAVVVITVSAIVIWFLTLEQRPPGPGETPDSIAPYTDSAAATDNTEESATANPTEGSEAVTASQSVPDYLVKIVQDNRMDIADFDFYQLITVEAVGPVAELRFFEKHNGVWSEAIPLVSGFVGAMGVSQDASEYADYTPAGLFSIGTAFGILDNPGTSFPYFKVTEDSYWVDDPDSEFYNRHVEGTEGADWQSAEHLIDYQPNYNYAAFIEYNAEPVIPGMGSAFFLHVGYAPTAGCVAISEDTMKQVLCWMREESSPHILIFSSGEGDGYDN